ncbi:UNVERIFIED_CONTAM: hypothetical protein PYX00_009209 [Menopon gallinae]|uniref:Hypoxia up-regulated protein 1 n=1 Tax=Menopon gallinae TaxID=328185 RepID=A0AAW2HAN6_9NEOP
MKSPLWGCLVIALLSTINNFLADGVAVMSVDFGSEWMKVALVSPGVLMEIALNKESKRKTPAFISFRDGERTFGEDAQNIAVRFPSNGYGYLLDLLGKKADNPIVKLYQERFPYHNITEDPERGTVVFQYDVDTRFTPEEMIGMLLRKAREFAEESAGQPITDAVLIVPGYFNQAERKAFVNAANMGGLRVLQLMNDYAAVALNYGIFRRKDFTENTQYIMFYDMGASSTSAALVAYQMVKYKDKGMVETNPQATIIGVGYDRTLGGLEMQVRLQKYLAKKFNEVKKTKLNVFDNPRAMAKLFKEAGRVKNVLSANVDHYAQIEGLLDNENFKLLVTREEFENLCQDLFDRVSKPIEQALKTSGLHLDLVNQVILVGGGTRVPKIQEKLAEYLKMELGKNINADEAAVMGAVYRAAEASNGFKVKKFIVKDAVLFPIQVTFPRANNGTEEVRFVKKTLFGVMSSYPQKKILTFNKHTDDFAFTVGFGDLDHIPPQELQAVGSLNLSKIELKGVKEAIEKHGGDNVEFKGIKAHFLLDDSGILSLVNVDFVAEKNVIEDEEQSTLQKIGSSFTKLFGGSESDSGKNDEKQEENVPESKEEQNETPEEKTEKTETKTADKTGSNTTEETKPEKESAKNQTEKVDKKPKIVVIKENISASFEDLGVPFLTVDQFDNSVKKIKAMDEFDENKRRTEKARNALESYVFDALNKLDTAQYAEAATDKEKESITNACQEISNWLDEEFNAEANTYEEKLTHVKSLTGPLYRRVKEHEERPEALAALTSILNGSTFFLNNIRSSMKEAADAGNETSFNSKEVDDLEKLIKETKEWQVKMEEEQSKLPLSVTPKLTIKSIGDKMAALDREVKYLVNKAKYWKPRKIEKKASNETIEEINVNKTVNKESTKSEPKIEFPPVDENVIVTDEDKNKSKKDIPEESSGSALPEAEKLVPNEDKDEEKHEEL